MSDLTQKEKIKIFDILTDSALSTEGLLPKQTPFRDEKLSIGGRKTSTYKDTVLGKPTDWEDKKIFTLDEIMSMPASGETEKRTYTLDEINNLPADIPEDEILSKNWMLEGLKETWNQTKERPFVNTWLAGARVPKAVLSAFEALQQGKDVKTAISKAFLDIETRPAKEIAHEMGEYLYGDVSTNMWWEAVKQLPFATAGTVAEIFTNPAIKLTWGGVKAATKIPIVAKFISKPFPAPKWFDDLLGKSVRFINNPFKEATVSAREGLIDKTTKEIVGKYGEIIKENYRNIYRTEPTDNDIYGVVKAELIKRGAYGKTIGELQQAFRNARKLQPGQPGEAPTQPTTQPKPTAQMQIGKVATAQPPAATPEGLTAEQAVAQGLSADVWYHGGQKGIKGDIISGMVTKDPVEAQKYAQEVDGDVYVVPNEAVIQAQAGDVDNDGQSLGNNYKNYGYIRPIKAGEKGWNAQLLSEYEAAKAKLSPKEGGEINAEQAVAKSMSAEEYVEAKSKDVFYHGTKAAIQKLSEADPSAFSRVSSIYGEGLYLTDNPKIAEGYSKTRGKGEEGKVLAAEVSAKNLIDLDKELPQDVQNIFMDEIKRYTDEIPPSKKGTDVYDFLRETLAENELYESDVVGIFQDINNSLWGKGYEGLKHIGGRKIKTPFGEHNVVILFQDPYTLKIPTLKDIKNPLTKSQLLSEYEAAKAKLSPKEGGGLIEEAKKYKTAEEFVASRKSVKSKATITKLDNLSEKDGMRVVIADVDKLLNANWYGNKPGEAGITKLPFGSDAFANKYLKAKDFIKKTGGDKIEMPHITGFLKDGAIMNIEGMHRFLVFKDMGAKQMAIAVPKNTDISKLDWVISERPSQLTDIWNKANAGKTPPPPDKPTAVSPDEPIDPYNKVVNISKIKKQGTSKRDISYFIDRTFVPISTRLSKIDEGLRDIIRKHAFSVNINTKKNIDAVIPFLQKMSKLPADEAIKLDFALKNADDDYIQAAVKKHGLTEEYNAVRKTLDDIYKRAKAAGMDVGYITSYFPRRITNLDEYLKFLRGTDSWGAIQKALLDEKSNVGRELTDEEKAEVVNSMIRGFGENKIKLTAPSNIKERKIVQLTPEMNAFYKDSGVALTDYIRSMNDNIEARVFFGKEANLDESIGNYVTQLVEDKMISPEDERSVREILHSYFNKRGTHGVVTGYKNFAYIASMGSPTSAITQIGDLAFSLYSNGFYGTVKAAFKKGKITKQDIGIDLIAEEFTDASKSSKAVSKVFKMIGLDAMDAFGKEVLINGALDRLSAQAAKNDPTLISTLNRVFGAEKSEEVLISLKDKVPTDDVKYMLFSELANFQPISLTEMPEYYVRGGNMRIFYMLKSYTLKQIDVFHNEIFREKDAVKKVQKLVRLMFALALMGATADVIKDFMLGRKTPISDMVVNNILKIVGFSKWQIYKSRQDGLFQTMLQSILPPVPFLDDMYKDAMRMTNKKKKGKVEDWRIWQRIPLAGKFYYWWFGGGSELKNKKKSTGYK